ncbi:MAG: phosphopantetheine-binding protein [Chloroflexota bacterium]
MDSLLHDSLQKRLQALSPQERELLKVRLGLAAEPAETRSKLVGFVTDADSADAVQLREHLRQALPQYMIPDDLIALDELPRTPNGKLDRARLQQIATEADSQPEMTPGVAHDAATETEQFVMGIWEDLLHTRDLSVQDDFFHSGGNSLMAVRMLARIKSEVGVDLPVSVLVKSPTIARLAQSIRDTQVSAVVPAITTLQEAGTAPPLYFLPLHIHGALHYRHVNALMGDDRPLFGFEAFDATREDPYSVENLAAKYVEDLLVFQPDGPYYLCGVSIAGLLAFEMARQLEQRGITNVEVLLLDTFGPGYPRHLPPHRAIAAQMQWFGLSPVTNAYDRRERVVDVAWYWVDRAYSTVQSVRSVLKPSEEAGDTPPQHEIDRALGLMTAAYLNPHRPYRGAVTLFRGSLQPWNAAYDATLGWEQFVAGGVHVVPVRGDHLGILKRYHAHAAADALKQRLLQLDMCYQTNR